MVLQDVFEDIQLDPQLEKKVSELEIVKLTARNNSDLIVVHATAPRMVSYVSLDETAKEIEKQFFDGEDKTVCIRARFDDIEKEPDAQTALVRLCSMIAQEYIATYRRSYDQILKEATVTAEDDCVVLTLPADAYYTTCEEAFRTNLTERIRFWSDRFRNVVVRYGEPEDLLATYSQEREYTADEYAELVRRRKEKSAQKQTADRKPRDLVKREPVTPAEPAEKPSYRKKRLPQDPDVFFGRGVDTSVTVPISSLMAPLQDVVVHGQVFNYEEKELPSRTAEDGRQIPPKKIITFNITDFEDSISVKFFPKNEDLEDIHANLKENAFIYIHAETDEDRYSKEIYLNRIRALRKSSDHRIKRKDTAPVKRVELHCHTQMSDMDAVVDTAQIVKRAFEWGHPAIAITDHGVVQSFVDAFHAIDPKKFADDPVKTEAFKKFKIIYGMEGYIVDDEGVTHPDGTPYDLEKDKDEIKRLPSYHIILLCKNDVGRNNLYRLVSRSHIDYFHRGKPRIPKSLLRQMREGLIIGSACEAGELFRAVLFEKPEEELRRIRDFYDYYEIQPLGNNNYMIDSEKIPNVTCKEDLANLNRRIVELADEDGKLCVATCDVHFLEAEDEIYRRIIMAGKGFEDADRQPPLYYRTTDEMLEEFDYLPEKKAYEVVVTNTNIINAMIDRIEPVRPDKCPPVIENSDVELREMCYNTAHDWYGENLPQIVSDRLEKELHSIISNGFAVMYIIAQRLVKHSNDDGYLVGSRGSVGSSFVATMSGITEVNPLPAHYYCRNCRFNDFDSEEVKAYSQMSGFDLPDRTCPVCGKPLKKDGQNIPFETFLGFFGDKEPDIDLNFSSVYQSRAHAYTEVLFGKGYTYRAGTVGTLADKTAYGYIKKYYEDHGINKRNAEIERLIKGCVGVRRSTGQHPGGIIVLPHGEEIDTFTPVQHPANDMTTETVTTHFDYHKIDHNLLKLDILGHEDPTMIRMLEDLTGIDAKSIPMDDRKVISLMQSTEALGIRPEDIDGCELGSLGLPELGTSFVMKMLQETKPQSFSDMIRISGLSHGTNVWTGNTQDLIEQGKCTLSTAICTRDDIMVFLIHMGLDNQHAFNIMEKVRKGKGLTPEMEEEMVAHGVPDWYIWSCKRIQYMFPKAHACAYVMMAFRVAYCKVYYPLAYYTAYFTIRATNFDYDIMAKGRDKMERVMREFIRKNNTKSFALSDKEQGMLKDMRIVQEMYARGFEFLPIDLYRAKAEEFQIIDGKIMPSLTSIGGLGVVAAQAIAANADPAEPFLSIEDIRNRCRVGKSTTDLLKEVGLLDGMQESNQMSLLDIFGEFV